MSAFDPVLSQETRLRVMAVLYRHRDVAVVALRDHLRLTDGNLATHLRRLEASGFVARRRALGPEGFHARVRITGHGSRSFGLHLQKMAEFLKQHMDQSDPSDQG